MTKQAQKKLTEEEVRNIARLAQLTLTDEEVKKFQGQLSSVLEYISLLGEVDTSLVEQIAQVTELENIFRADETFPSLPPKTVLSGAPERHDGFFSTEAVLEE